MWVASKFTERHYRDDAPEIFHGRKYNYHWVPRRMEVRRYDAETGAEVIAKCLRKPRNGQELAQLFFNKKMSDRYANYVPPVTNPGLPDGVKGQFLPWARVVVVDPMNLDVAQLGMVYRRLNEAWPRDSRFTDHGGAVIRVSNALENHRPPLVIVDRPPPAVQTMSVAPRIHIVPRDELPEDAWRSPHARRFDDQTEIRLLVSNNPKRAGTASHRRFQFYRDWMTITDYVSACVSIGYSRQVARDDVTHDWGKHFIALKLPDGTEPEAPPRLMWNRPVVAPG